MGDWSRPTRIKEMIEKFENIFTGLTVAYGQYQKGDRSENGKQKGKGELKPDSAQAAK